MAEENDRLKDGAHDVLARPSPEELRRQVAEAAYYRAEARGFAEGDELKDWLEAERIVGSGKPREPLQQAGGGAVPDGAAQGEEIKPNEITDWAARLDVTARKLREAIERVGPLARDVARFLDKRQAPRSKHPR